MQTVFGSLMPDPLKITCYSKCPNCGQQVLWWGGGGGLKEEGKEQA